MAQTPSTMLPLGTNLPHFRLTNAVNGDVVDAESCSGSITLISFLCNHCPYVVHVQSQYRKLQDDYVSRGVKIIGINSNSLVSHPQDGPSAMKELALKLGWTFPFVFDETQSVARAFQAACTPEFYLFDAKGSLVYRGQLDDSRPSNGKPVTGKHLREAIDAVLAGQPVTVEQVPSVGCNIKWNP